MATDSGKRISKHWTVNHKISIDEFNKDEITKDNLVNEILLIKDEDVTSSLVMELFGKFGGKSLCNHYDTFEIPVNGYRFKKGEKYVSNKTPIITTFGIWIFNVFLLRDIDLADCVGGYYNKNINKKLLNKIIGKLSYGVIEDKITTEQFKKFLDRTQFIMPFETILSPSHTEKILSCTKEINKLKHKLFKENKEALDKGDESSAAVAEDIENQLKKFAMDYLKDDPSLDPYLSGAGGNIDNNFKNMYIMKGAIRNPDPTAKKEYEIAESSFIDGISQDEYSLLARSLSGGPYSRAKKTELGGYWEKLIEAATNTVVLDEPGTDCGTDKYLEFVLTDDLVSMFMYSYIILSNGKLEELTSSNIDKFINKKVKVRSAMFCKNKSTICNCCAGNFFYRRGGKNVGLACAQIPTKLKLRSMKAFHDSTVSTTEIDPMKAFGFR